ncbi:MAG: hypothetical protein ACPG6B_00720 [Oceanihabitans sp.]
MRIIICFLVVVFNVSIGYSQAPEQISYQSIIRDASGDLVQNQNVGIQISILQGSDTGTLVYVETHMVTTNENGLATLSIGTGTTSGDLATINWETGPYYIKSETDPQGGTNYTIAGTSQLLSVPYALYAKTSGNANPQVEGTEVGDMLYWDGDNWQNIPVGLPGQFLRLSENNIPVWSGATYPEIQASLTSFTQFSATFNHEIVSDGGTTITKRGMCWNTNPNPIISDNKRELPFSNWPNPVESIHFSLLNANTLYYARPYVISELGVTYGEEISFTTESNDEISVGNAYQGGVIGYILQPEDPGYDASTSHGLIIYFTNGNYGLHSGYWGCNDITIEGTLPDFGSGQANTTAIINGCNDTNSAAKYCDDLVNDGFDDWFLPSVEELGKISTNSNIIHESMGMDLMFIELCWTSTEDYDDIYVPFSNPEYIDSAFVYNFGSSPPTPETAAFPKIENVNYPIPFIMAVRWF